MIKAVIFDLDGTLADTLPNIARALNETLVRFGAPARALSEYHGFINHGPRVLAARALPESFPEARIDEVLADYFPRYEKCYADGITPYDGVPELVKKLRARGIKTAVLTNKQDSVVGDFIAKLFGENMFDIALGKTDRFPTKPDPSAAHYILASLGVDAAEAVFVGDSPVDIRTAQAAEMYPVAVAWGYSSRDTLDAAGAGFIADTPDEICTFIENTDKAGE